MTRLPISYFGNVEYWQHIITEPRVLLEVHESFSKQSLRNRCEILGANGVLPLSAAVQGRSKGEKTKDVRLDFSENWPQRHWHSIKSAYGHSPFFEHYEQELQLFFKTLNKHNFLLDLCLESLAFIARWLQYPLNIKCSDSFAKGNKNDLRNRFKSSQKQKDYPEYYQTFSDRFSFESNLCILDLVFNQGNASITYLKQLI